MWPSPACKRKLAAPAWGLKTDMAVCKQKHSNSSIMNSGINLVPVPEQYFFEYLYSDKSLCWHLKGQIGLIHTKPVWYEICQNSIQINPAYSTQIRHSLFQLHAL